MKQTTYFTLELWNREQVPALEVVSLSLISTRPVRRGKLMGPGEIQETRHTPHDQLSTQVNPFEPGNNWTH